jgi:hypothetical protein
MLDLKTDCLALVAPLGLHHLFFHINEIHPALLMKNNWLVWLIKPLSVPLHIYTSY